MLPWKKTLRAKRSLGPALYSTSSVDHLLQEVSWARQLRTCTLLLVLGATALLCWLVASRPTVEQHIRLSATFVTTLAPPAANCTVLGGAVVAEGEKYYKTCRRRESGLAATPQLRTVQLWRSCKPRQRESVTVVTQLSLDRLDMLENQCSVWPDPIAAAVYVPTLLGRVCSAHDRLLNGSSVEEAVAWLDAFASRMQLKGACVLDMELVTQDFEEAGEAGLYPFNAARNRALLLAQTEALLLLDADFVPTPTFVSSYKSPELYAELLQRLEEPQVVVLPAFELREGQVSWNTSREELEGWRAQALEAVQRGKPFVLEQYRHGSMVGFQLDVYRGGHFATDYQRWEVEYSHYQLDLQPKLAVGYEPYVLVSRRYVPWYDERFWGYGWDKIQHIRHIRGLNITFAVDPAGFVVHVPHRKAATYRATKSTGQRAKLRELFKQVNRDIIHQRFVPVVSFPQLCPQ